MLPRHLASSGVRAAPQLAELTRGAHRTEEKHLVPYVVIRIDQIRTPAPSVGFSTSAAFATGKLGGSDRPDDAADDRDRKVAR